MVRRRPASSPFLRRGRRLNSDLGDELVAPARHRPDEVAILSERPSQRRDLDHQIVLLDHRVRPNAGHDLVLGDERAARLGQHHEYIESAAAELDHDPIRAELPTVRQQPEPAELDSPLGFVGQPHGSPSDLLMKFHIRLMESMGGSRNVPRTRFGAPGCSERRRCR